MKKRLTLILLFTYILAAGFAQKGFTPGYVVTNSFDTLRGQIKLQQNYLNSKSCEFIATGQQKAKIYKPEDLRSYRIENGKYYVAREVTIDSVPQKIFLEYLVNGIVDLYYLKEVKGERFFVDKGNVMTELTNFGKDITVVENENQVGEKTVTYYKPSNQYKRMMMVLFQDSPEALKEVNRTNFEYKSLINITVDYHNSVCKDYECINYTKSTTQHVYLEPWIGYAFETMTMKESDDKLSSSSPAIGLQLRFKPFKGYSNWDFLFGIGYSASHFEGDYVTGIYTYTKDPTFHLKADYGILKIPLIAEYTFPTKVVRPFISLSFINGIILNPETFAIRTDVNEGPEDARVRTYQISPAAGFGIILPTKGTGYFYLKNEFEYRKPVTNQGYIYDFTKVFSYNLSLGFGIRIK